VTYPTVRWRGRPRSAAAPSPFTPIAPYGFLSNCHTGALVAPDGTVDWLCVPRFDSPSVFGALLDRGAGGFRFGPFGINVPSDRIYEPGTNTIVTSWKTPAGWVIVRDALTIGPRRGEDTVTPHTRPPFDQDADHALVRTASCINGTVEIDLVCEPAFDYGRISAEWTLSEDRHRADAIGGEQALQLRTDMLVGIEAGRARARRVLRAGETVYCALAWSEDADASTLLAAIFGFLPAGDPRLRATVLAVADELSERGYVLRYRTEETDDGLSGKEGSFVICSFWLVSALAIVGEMQRARDLMERLTKTASPLGLFAEELDAETGRHLGNFPQAFSHLALVEAAARLIVAESLADLAG
jgi:GH15 family glucan-1,4-alpha-glucosidase